MARPQDPTKTARILKHLSKVRKDTMYGIGRAIDSRPYTAKAILDRLIQEHHVYEKISVEQGRVKHFYSLDPFPPETSTSPSFPSTQTIQVPIFFLKLQELFGLMLESEDVDVLAKYIAQMGLTDEALNQMQDEVAQFLTKYQKA